MRRGILASALRNRTLLDLNDADGARWGDLILPWFGDAASALAEDGLFTRTDLLPAAAGVAVYTPFTDVETVQSVTFDGIRLFPITENSLERLSGPLWSLAVGTPTHYIPGERLTLYPCPEDNGAVPAVVGVPPLTETQGIGVEGAGHTCLEDTGALVHYLPGDGTVTGAGTYVIAVTYEYLPGPVAAETTLPRAMADAIRWYAMARALEVSDDELESRQARRAWGGWAEAKGRLATAGRRSAELLPTLFTEGQPMPRVNVFTST